VQIKGSRLYAAAEKKIRDIAILPNMPEYAETESIPGISQAKVESAVSKLSRRKAVGPDGISAEEILTQCRVSSEERCAEEP